MLLVSDEVVDPSGDIPGGGVRCPVSACDGGLPGIGGFPTADMFPPPPFPPPPPPPPPPSPPADAGGDGITAWKVGAWPLFSFGGWAGIMTVFRGIGISLKSGTLASLESCWA